MMKAMSANIDSEIAVFPWMDIHSPVTVCGVTWYPRQAAIERAADHSAHVDAATSYFFDHFRLGDPSLGWPLELQRVKPAVVFVGQGMAHSSVELATNVLCFATIFANSSIFYANSTTFEHFFQGMRTGGDPRVNARRTRRMHGSQLNGSMVQNLMETRPAWCGTYHDPDLEMLAALETVIEMEAAAPLRRALEAIMPAMQDADTVTLGVEQSQYARSLERLLHRPGQRSGNRRASQRSLGAELLRPFLGSMLADVQDSAILAVRDAAVDERNAFWHPESRRAPSRAFEKQAAVHPNLLAFRAAAALIIGTIYAIDPIAVDGKLRSFVGAVEQWISLLHENDERESEIASEIGWIWSRRWLHENR